MKKFIIFLVLITIFLSGIKSYAQDIEPLGGLMIFIGSAPDEVVNAIAELFITDPKGRKAGLNISTGAVLQEIPNASYGKERLDRYEEGLSESITPTSGIYKVDVIGTAVGRC